VHYQELARAEAAVDLTLGQPCGEELRRTNAILSSVFGIEYPIGGHQWTRVCEARNALKDMLHGQRAPG